MKRLQPTFISHAAAGGGNRPERVAGRAIVALLLLGATSQLCAAGVIYIDRDAAGAHDGSSWCDAYTNLQDALAAAMYGDVIRVASGTYTPDPNGLPDPRQATFQLVSGVVLEGGYAGCGAVNPDQRDISAFETILSGDLLGNDADLDLFQDCCPQTVVTRCDDAACEAAVCAANPDCCGVQWGPICIHWAGKVCTGLCDTKADNAFHVVTGSGTDRSAVLSGFTITNGYAVGAGTGEDSGGGMYSLAGDPTVVDCRFFENVAGTAKVWPSCCCEHDSPGCASSECTAAVCAIDPSCCSGFWDADCVNLAGGYPMLEECWYMCNPPSGCPTDRTGGGGGMYNENADPEVTDTVFVRNRSEGDGGGMLNRSSSPIVGGCSFTSNTANKESAEFEIAGGGGIYVDSDSDPTLRTCRFVDNRTEGYGAGILIQASQETTVKDCIFVSNMAGTFGGGAAIDGDSDLPATPTFTDCAFFGNQGLYGGGVFLARGHPPFVNCVFSGNVASTGAGLFVTSTTIYFDSTPHLVSCSVVGNVATSRGGGLYNSANAILNNCVLWGNQDRDGIDETAQFHAAGSGMPAVRYSCIQGFSGSWPWTGTGNIGADPLIADSDGADDVPGTEDDDLRLLAGSPAIDAGDSTVVTVVTDMDGNVRMVDDPATPDTGQAGAGGPVVDMGAYEFGAGPFIPAISGWGLIVLAAMVSVGGTVVIRRRAGFEPAA